MSLSPNAEVTNIQPRFYVGARDMNTGPHVCVSDILIETSLACTRINEKSYIIELKYSVRGDHINQAVVFVLSKMYIINPARPEYHQSHVVKIRLPTLSPVALPSVDTFHYEIFENDIWSHHH